ncbi:hypothetical protein VP1G_03677 [Cytospora mali]|uniref:Uncharacterized protein n=1 Tax=Cytospora mali TaxID=578113 RepID=A0A194UXA7_CYTMA|nr:hypothetical protein VP1G_03677 [Valsa mali var. pyri (nom. inval.)]
MCKFTYLGYDRCDEPERHYLIRREKCSAKAHIKHWCAPHEQEEAASANQQGKFWVSLPCPMCANTPVVYDQPLLEIAHSRRSVLPAPHYDAVTGKYSRLPKHQTRPDDLPESVIPRPLRTNRMQVRRAATETAVPKAREASTQDYTLPATTYVPPPQELKLPKPLPIPQPVTLTPPSSREGSRSPPQIRMDGELRTTPPGEGNRRELDSIREKARIAATAVAKEPKSSTPDRARSDSASSASSSNESARPSQPSRQLSNASSTTASSLSSKTTTTTIGSRHRYQWQAHSSRPAQQDSMADTLAHAALRSIGIDRSMSRSASPSSSPERGRKTRRRPTGGSSSERSDSPSVWRPTISPPVLQNDSLGIGSVTHDVEPFKQRLVPFPPVPSKMTNATPNGASVAKGEGLVENPPRPKTPHPHPHSSTKMPALSLFPNAADDEEVAAAAFEKMFAAEAKAHAYQVRARAQALTDAQAQVETQIQARAASEGTGNTGNTGKKDKPLPSVAAPLRRIISGQVRTVNVPPPRPLKRQNTTEGLVSAASSSSSKSSPQPGGSIMKVKPGPLFSFAGVGGKAQEFEIVTGPDGSILKEPAYGQAF